MDTICVYKDKLNEVLTLIPAMSQAKKLEAVSYWNSAACHFQQIVNEEIPNSDRPQPQVATGQSSEINQEEQASDMNSTVILNSENRGGDNTDQIMPSSPDNIVIPSMDIASPSRITEGQFSAQDVPLGATLFGDEYFSANMIEEMQQLSPSVNDGNIQTVQAYPPDEGLRLTSNISQADPLTIINAANNQYDSPSPLTGLAGVNSLSLPSLIGNQNDILDNEIHVVDGELIYPPSSSAIESSYSDASPGTQTQPDFCTSGANMAAAQANLNQYPSQTRIAPDIGNGQFDRGPGHGITGPMIADIVPTSSSVGDPAFMMDNFPLVNMRNEAFTHGARPLQQIQVFGQPGSQLLVSCDSGANNHNSSNAGALITPPSCSSSQLEPAFQSGNLSVKLECDPDGMFDKSETHSDLNACKLCGKSGFSTKGNLKRHLKAHSGDKPFECEHCGTKFTEKKSLKIHIRRHTGEKPYACEICHKPFAQTGVLKSHMALHYEERKFACNKCEKTFRQRSQLKLHLMRHEGIKKLECSECPSKFLTKGDLERHFRIHTGERPYTCEKCGKKFTRQQSLNEHNNRHVGRKPYDCKHCDKSFSEMSACYKHKKVHKKDEQVRQLEA